MNPPMDVKLVLVGGEANPAEIRLRLPAILGRGRQATLVLPHPLISRNHCEIAEYDGYLIVKDLGSLNGTFVNQRRIEQALLPPGGLLTLGPLSFRAVYSNGASQAAARSPFSETSSLLADDASSAESLRHPGLERHGTSDKVPGRGSELATEPASDSQSPARTPRIHSER